MSEVCCDNFRYFFSKSQINIVLSFPTLASILSFGENANALTPTDALTPYPDKVVIGFPVSISINCRTYAVP